MDIPPEDAISVLVVDDDTSVLKSWKAILSESQYNVTLFSDPKEVVHRIDKLAVDVAVVDIRMPTLDGMELLSIIKSRRPEVEVVMMTGYGGVQDAVEAIKKGAYDFLSKPFESMEAAELTVRRAADRILLERRVKNLEQERNGHSIRGLIGQSPAIKKVTDLVRSVSSSSATVLIIGESGTGKELVARALHEKSPRKKKPLVTLNCSALTETLLESELFGHAKGAFSGATSNHQGLFEAADGGTIFLDEIGEMSQALQVKLLRTLQEGEVRPVGSTQNIKVDVRVIAATNVDLDRMCQEGTFRQDLYYRLNVVRVDMPPLKQRGDDIPMLAHHFLKKYEQISGKHFEGIRHHALQKLNAYDWPGNVRELENVIERAVVLSRGKTISATDLPAVISGKTDDAELIEEDDPEKDFLDEGISFPDAKARAVRWFEENYLRNLLLRHDNISAAAREAGLDRSNFKRLLRRHNIDLKH